MMALAMVEHFPYEPGIFWLTAVLVILTVLLAWLAWHTWKGEKEKASPALVWSVNKVPLLTSSHVVRDGLAVSWQHHVLTNPTILTFNLSNKGTADLGTGAFDGGRPIIVTFDTPPLTQLDQAAAESIHLLPLVIDGNELRIGPGLLHSDRELNVGLLVEGETKVSTFFPLVDIEIENADDRQAKEIEQIMRIRNFRRIRNLSFRVFVWTLVAMSIYAVITLPR